VERHTYIKSREVSGDEREEAVTATTLGRPIVQQSFSNRLGHLVYLVPEGGKKALALLAKSKKKETYGSRPDLYPRRVATNEAEMRRFRDCVGPKGVPVFRIWQIRVGGTVVFAPYAAQTRRGYVASSPLRAGVRSYGSSERVRMAVVTLPARTCYSTAADGQSGSVLKDTSGKDYRITTILPGDGASENKVNMTVSALYFRSNRI
jgi:hypothetical protein